MSNTVTECSDEEDASRSQHSDEESVDGIHMESGNILDEEHGNLLQQFSSPLYPFVPWNMHPLHMQQFVPPTPSPVAHHLGPGCTHQHFGASASISAAPAQVTKNPVEEWCQKYALDDEDCQSLKKLGFKVGDKLDALGAEIWEWAAVPPLARIRILNAYVASKAENPFAY